MEAIMGGDGLSPYNPGVWPGIPEMIPLEYHCDVSAFGGRSFLWYMSYSCQWTQTLQTRFLPLTFSDVSELSTLLSFSSGFIPKNVGNKLFQN